MSQVACFGGGSRSRVPGLGCWGAEGQEEMKYLPLVRTVLGKGEDSNSSAEPPSSLLHLVLGKAKVARQSHLAPVGGKILWERKHLLVRFGLVTRTRAGKSQGKGLEVL